ncbi:PQQ-dependent sugar dehydrogenase [Planococcus salinus]|uniref:Quinoprotein glucose dehydrogenase n=1 Tax=Planococcus salinus TaxID=1848460 RepID=A0A3M8P9U9_9BACL|nr:PQQ-dependent sugar dehydrogenase [Planococcus salinus]RNF40458.1 quinoprotein glucose dehydrogenase [Planococcus salinus]
MKKWMVSSLFFLMLTGCNSLGNTEPSSGGTPENTDNELEEIATNLETPWSINKVGEEFYISERPGTVAHIDADGQLTRQEVAFSDNVSNAAETGFLGFALKSDFSESQEAYAYYVYERDGRSFNKIVVLSLEEGSWQETDVLIDSVPTGNVHHGGRLELDNNGVLFATIGDASHPELAQDPASVNGKILRLNEYNEFQIYSMGHRNPQGLAWSGDDLYASEHGQSADDEINKIEEGQNYGWPLIEGNESEEGLESPFFTTGADETWAPSGIAIQDGLLYVATLRGEAIRVIDLETAEPVDSIDGFGRIRDVLSDGDDLYFITNNTDGRGDPAQDDDKLYRMSVE